jgi:uncharacterized protein (TIGR00255 family)
MPKSMTGFGRAAREGAFGQVTVEVKSVNHRFLKTQLRLPGVVESLEPEMENRIRARLARGAVTVSVDLRQREAQMPQQLDPAIARGQLDRVKAVWQAVFPEAAPPEPARLFELLMRLPAPPSPATSTLATETEQAVLAALDDALAALERSREAEGGEIALALAAHGRIVAARREEIARKAPVAIKAAQAKFVDRINQILAEVRPGLTLDAEAVLRESALYADRGDVTEELARLEGHLLRFDEVLRAPAEAGRRLEFLLQEMLREANTIGSKSFDLAVSHDVVEVKAEIEKMKEQVQNLE